MSLLYDLRNVVVAATVGAAFGYALARIPAGEGEVPDQGAYIRKLLAEIEILKADRKKLESDVERLLEESDVKTAQLQQATIHSHLPAHESSTTPGKQEKPESESSTNDSELIDRCQSLQRQLEAATAAAAAERRNHEERCRQLEQLQAATPAAEVVKHSDDEFSKLRQELESRLRENQRLEADNKQLADRARELQWQLEAKADETITAASAVQVEKLQSTPETVDYKKELEEKEKFTEKLIEENKQLDEECRSHADQMKQLELRFQTAAEGSQEQSNRCAALEKELQTAKQAAEEGKKLATRCVELEKQLSTAKKPVEEITKASVAATQEAPIMATRSPVQEAARGMDDQATTTHQLKDKEEFAEKLMGENVELEERCRTYADQLKQLELQLNTAREQQQQDAKAGGDDVTSQAALIKDLQQKNEVKQRELDGYKALLANFKAGKGPEDAEKKKLLAEIRNKSTVAANLMQDNQRLLEENKQQADYCELLKEKLEVAEDAAADTLQHQEKRCRELGEQLSDAKETSQQQEHICSMLKQQLQTMTEKMHQQQLRCKQLEDQAARAAEEAGKVEEKVQKAEAETTQAAAGVSKATGEVKKETAEVTQESPEQQQLKLQEEMLKEAFTTATMAEAKLSQKEERVHELEQQLEKAMVGRDLEQEEVIDELRARLKATEEAAVEVTQKQEDRCRELEKQLQAATASFVNAISANREYEKQCVELQQQLEVVGKTASDSTEAIFTYEERCEELQGQIDGAKSGWEASDQAKHKLEVRCRELEKKLQAAAASSTKENKQQETYFKELEQQLQGASTAREEHEKLAKEVKEQLDANQKENEELKTQVASLQQQTHVLKVERTDELATRDQRIEELEATLASVEDASQGEVKGQQVEQEQVESVSAKKLAEKQHVEEREQLKTQMTDLEQKVLTLEIDRANLESELQTKLERIQELETSLVSMKTGKQVVKPEGESKPALSAFRSLVRSLKRLDKPLLDLDVKQVNEQIKATSRVAGLEDGGALLVDWSNKPHRVVRVDRQGGTTGAAFTCPSNSVLCGIVVHQDSVFTLQKDGTICQCSIDSLAEAKAKYKVDSGNLRDGLALDSDRLVLVDMTKGEVFIYNLQEKKKESKVKGLNKPTGITRTTDVEGVVNYVVTENGAHRLVVYSDNWELRRSIGSFGPGDGHLSGPSCTIVSPEGNLLVADYGNHRICEFSPTGRFLRHCLTKKEGLRHLQCIYLNHPFLWVAYFDGNKYNVKRFKMYQ